MVRASALAAIAIGVVAGSGPVRADRWPGQVVAGYGLQEELGQLTRIRERLVRRRALQHALERELDELAGAIDGLQQRRERTRARMRDDQDELRALERELDRIVPRLAGRARMVHERRRRAARALADLASLGRRDALDPTTRARLRAISPVLLERIRSTDVVIAAWRRQRDRALARQQTLAGRALILRAESRRLQDQIEQRLRQRLITADELAQLDVELDRLSGANARLGRIVLVARSARMARVEPQADQPALQRPRSGPGAKAASVRGYASAARSAPGRLAQTMRARARSSAQVATPTRSLALAGPALAVHAPHAALPPAAAGPIGRAAMVEVARSAVGGDGRVAVARASSAALAARPVAGLSARVPAARLPGLEPIRPALAVVAERSHRTPGRTGITIAAAPGQGVAAPDDGRIVFADSFKSYGLLLIIEHENEYHSLMWGFSRLRVGFGDEVQGGQVIGVMDVVDGHLPQLHVELRRNGRPVNPSFWLAGSSSKVRG